jgi:hypothetical protein
MPGHGRPACLTCQSPLPTVRSTVHQRWYTDTGSPPRARPGPTRPCTPAGRRDRRGVRGGCPAVPWGGGAHRHRVRACMTVMLGTAKSQQRRRGGGPPGPRPRIVQSPSSLCGARAGNYWAIECGRPVGPESPSLPRGPLFGRFRCSGPTPQC